MEKLWVEHKILFLSLSSSKTLIYFHQKQYPLKPKVEGLKPIIENLKGQKLLILCNSPCNTPILSVKKVK